jgi:hypothetical protein
MNKLAEFFQSNHTGLGLAFYPTHFIFAAFPSLALARANSRRNQIVVQGLSLLQTSPYQASPADNLVPVNVHMRVLPPGRDGFPLESPCRISSPDPTIN